MGLIVGTKPLGNGRLGSNEPRTQIKTSQDANTVILRMESHFVTKCLVTERQLGLQINRDNKLI